MKIEAESSEDIKDDEAVGGWRRVDGVEGRRKWVSPRGFDGNTHTNKESKCMRR
jgi:hypothetical protein